VRLDLTTSVIAKLAVTILQLFHHQLPINRQGKGKRKRDLYSIIIIIIINIFKVA